jgi:hypothetical protein
VPVKLPKAGAVEGPLSAAIRSAYVFLRHAVLVHRSREESQDFCSVSSAEALVAAARAALYKRAN